MKPLITILLYFLTLNIFGQTSDNLIKGNVSFLSSQNIYVKFTNTEGINVGDTLFVLKNNKMIPAMIVNNISSISCVGISISSSLVTLSTQIIAKKKAEITQPELEEHKTLSSIPVTEQAIKAAGNIKKTDEPAARFDGRLTLSSYSNVSNYSSNQRFRYNVSINAEHISNSKFSAETYLTFSHLMSFPRKPTDWKGLNNAMKVYSLAVKYDINKTASITLGRKINNNMANVGAVDGLQFENAGKNVTYGALIGSRPDYYDYSFNSKLLQFGAFVSHNYQSKIGNMQTSLAFFNQMNQLKTDRRYAYFQHSNSLLKNLDLFCSFEFDLYSVIDSISTNIFDLTSTYVSLRYKPWKQLSMSLSYDARKNIYYYETFKSQIDSILDKSTRQGFRFNTIIRPFDNLMLGGNAGYRLPTKVNADTLASMNASGYLTYTRLPMDISATLNATIFKTGYTNGTVYGVELSKDFLNGMLNTELEYRLANYTASRGFSSKQNIAELSLSWRLAKKLFLSADFEATFEKDIDGKAMNAGRVFLSITQRF